MEDNAALYHALKGNNPVVPVFIFDKNILDELEEKADRRVEFIRAALEEMQQQLIALGSSLEVYYGTPQEVYKLLLKKYTIEKVFINRDYEPYAGEREAAIQKLLAAHETSLHGYKDQVIFEKAEIMKDDGTPYTVFTPYSKRWKAALTDFYLKSYPAKKYFGNFYKQSPVKIPSLKTMDFTAVDKPFPSQQLNKELIKKYSAQRDYPAVHGTSKLGVHLRFGTISIRKLATKAMGLNQTFLNELIWRDFYHMILSNFPQAGKGRAFKPAYEMIEWRNNEIEFERWCNDKLVILL